MIRSAMAALGLVPVVAATTPSIELFKSPDCLCCEGTICGRRGSRLP